MATAALLLCALVTGAPAHAAKRQSTVRVTLVLRHVRVTPGRLEITAQLRSTGPAMATVEVMHAGQLVVRFVRHLDRGTVPLRWVRRISDESRWRGRYRFALHVTRE